jgi:hypothetical protein
MSVSSLQGLSAIPLRRFFGNLPIEQAQGRQSVQMGAV